MGRCIVYIDGFNLYHRSLKDSAFKWLDLWKLGQQLTKQSDTLIQVKFFTAKVSDRPYSIGTAARQDAYLKALGANPKIQIIYGHFLVSDKMARVVEYEENLALRAKWAGLTLPKFVKVEKTEEKGTDVNLAVHLVADAHNKKFDSAIVVSNDSDLAPAMHEVVRNCHKRIIAYYPFPKSETSVSPEERALGKRPKQTPSAEIRRVVGDGYTRFLSTEKLATSQLTIEVTTRYGSIKKPSEW